MELLETAGGITELFAPQSAAIVDKSEPGRKSWKTVSVADEEFRAYLDGHFSWTHRAIPVKSLHVGTSAEEVTFAIVPIESIEIPTWPRLLWQLIRGKSLILSVGPMVATLALLAASGVSIDGWVAGSAFLAVLFLQIGLNLFNDYGDHIQGGDRLRVNGGSRVIQRGWMTAMTVRRLAWGTCALSLVFAFPAFFASSLEHGWPLKFVALLTCLIGFEFAFQYWGLRYRGWAEIFAFALTGPLLTIGYAWSVSGQIGLPAFCLGCFYGSLSLLYFHAVNFENIMDDALVGVSTWATRAGFDASKKFFYFCFVLGFACLAIFLRSAGIKAAEFAASLVIFSLVSGVVGVRIFHMASPLSSRMQGLRRWVLWGAWIMTFSLALLLFTSYGI